MAKINTTKLKILNKVVMEKISIAANEITLTNDKMTFIERMISLSNY